jgi:8-amino-7-oxononanoate synthase
MMVRAVVPPTVPEGTSRVRICLHAGNTEMEIKHLVDSIEEWALLRPEFRANAAEEEKRLAKHEKARL